MIRRTRAFSLIEVLVAIALIATVAVMITSFTGSLRTTRDAQFVTTAQAFARSYFDLASGLWSHPGNYQSNILPIAADAGGFYPPEGYEYSVSVDDFTNPLAPKPIVTYRFQKGVAPPNHVDITNVQLKRLQLWITLPNGKMHEYVSLLAAAGTR